MLQLRRFLFPPVAISSVLSFSIGSQANISIVNSQIALDGYSCPSTRALGTFSGPIIKASKGDNFKFNVTDLLNDTSIDLATSIHWHGIFQKTTNYANGLAFVTQCPIVSKENFHYDFEVPDQAGTFWYHCYFKNQYCDGLRGALIIYDPNVGILATRG